MESDRAGGGVGVNGRWAAHFPRHSLAAALPLRLIPGVQVLNEGSRLWITGQALTAEIEPILRSIPDIARFSVSDDATLTPLGRRIPTGSLPDGQWTDFAALAQLQPQPAAMPAKPGPPVPLRWVRSAPLQEPTALVLPMPQWLDYAVAAPQVRLAALRFAVCSDGRTLVLGQPLPPLRGTYFVQLAGLLIPAGYHWLPAIDPQILRRAMQLQTHVLALFDPTGHYEVIATESLVPASRSAARLSAGAP